MGLRMDTTLFLVVCWCVMMVSAKSVETSVRSKRTTLPIDNSCNNVKKFFQSQNITMDDGKSKGSVCGGECCSNATEDLLKKQGEKHFATLLRHNSRSLQGTLSFTAAAVQNHLYEVSQQSENNTLLLFSQVYKSMAVLSKEPISRLYSDIRTYIQMKSTKTDLSSSSVDIKASVSNFFANFFPLVYHNILHINGSLDFAMDYKECLKKTIEMISPFGDIPKQISQSLSKSLEATRLLLQAFTIGTEVLNTTDRLLVEENSKNNPECHQALLKMNYCPKCLGLVKHTKPCSGYCLNVLRGCLSKYVAELDSPWNGYVEGMESLVNAIKRKEDAGVNPYIAIKSLESKISEAIMQAMQKMKDIDTKVQRNCGKPTFVPRIDPIAIEMSTPPPRSSSPQESNLMYFLTTISKTRGFYGRLANTLCEDESFADQKDQLCWNGERIAEYSKMVVDVGLDMQRYNPEVKPMTNSLGVDPRIAELADKLRHVHHLAMSSAGSSSSYMDYMQRDGFEGSGSGNGADDDNDEDYNPTGSGSGNGPVPEVDIPHQTRKNYETESPPPAAGQLAVQCSTVLSLAVLFIARLF